MPTSPRPLPCLPFSYAPDCYSPLLRPHYPLPSLSDVPCPCKRHDSLWSRLGPGQMCCSEGGQATSGALLPDRSLSTSYSLEPRTPPRPSPIHLDSDPLGSGQAHSSHQAPSSSSSSSSSSINRSFSSSSLVGCETKCRLQEPRGCLSCWHSRDASYCYCWNYRRLPFITI